MKIEGNQIRPGNVIIYQDRLWRVLKSQHVKPGKGGAYSQVELRDIRHGTKTNVRFRASESIERAFLEHRKHSYLYAEGNMHTFMDTETFEQRMVSAESIGAENMPYLADGVIVELEIHDGEIMGMSLPETMTFKVVETEASVKGQTATGSYKPAVLSNAMRIMVPPYVEVGTQVVVRTADGTFVGRA